MGAINANQIFAVDMQTWLAQESGAYFSGLQTALHNDFPDELYGGADAVGVWGAPPRIGVFQAAQQYSDWIYTASFSAPNIDLNAYAKNSFQTQYYTRADGDVSHARFPHRACMVAGRESLQHLTPMCVLLHRQVRETSILLIHRLN